MPPIVTVVTPSLNQGRFIRATIESVLAQDYPYLEYIIVDGGSRDETRDVVDDYKGRLTWICEPDRGQSHAINKGFRRAKGDIVAWLNSDDIMLPGAVHRAVDALEKERNAGGVYADGYLLDTDGDIKSRFPWTGPFNLWKLVYLADYVLQQTLYVRKSVLDDVGYLDESLHWGMDWELLMRIGKRYPLVHLPDSLGCLREYPETKSLSGGHERFRELVKIMRRHGRRRFPPGYWFYGIDTYETLWSNWVRRALPAPWASRIQPPVTRWLRRHIDRVARTAQGLYDDGWAGPRSFYMLPAGTGDITIRGTLPPYLHDQTLKVRCHGASISKRLTKSGPFEMVVPEKSLPRESAVELELTCTRHVVPAKSGLGPDSRRLAFMLDGIEWTVR